MTPCHGVQAALTPIYLLQEGRRIGRKEIGHIKACPVEKCSKTYGEPVRYAGTGGFSDEEWQRMLKVRQRPPFYFVRTSRGLYPEDSIDSCCALADGGTAGAVGQPKTHELTGAEKAAGEAIEEPEWVVEENN